MYIFFQDYSVQNFLFLLYDKEKLVAITNNDEFAEYFTYIGINRSFVIIQYLVIL
jgi:hypothetical protein